MSGRVLWIILVTAPLVSAGSFEATCGATVTESCSGIWTNGTDSFSFGVPFIGSPEEFDGAPTRYGDGDVPPEIDVSIGTIGGIFTYRGDTCTYDVTLGGFPCHGEVSLGASISAPDDTGLSLGDVVSVMGLGSAQGLFCWGTDCPPSDLREIQVFDLRDVRATYQFTLTDPGTPTPFSWTGAEFSWIPEPATWVFTTLGLAGVAAGFRGQHRYRRTRNRASSAPEGI